MVAVGVKPTVRVELEQPCQEQAAEQLCERGDPQQECKTRTTITSPIKLAIPWISFGYENFVAVTPRAIAGPAWGVHFHAQSKASAGSEVGSRLELYSQTTSAARLRPCRTRALRTIVMSSTQEISNANAIAYIAHSMRVAGGLIAAAVGLLARQRHSGNLCRAAIKASALNVVG